MSSAQKKPRQTKPKKKPIASLREQVGMRTVDAAFAAKALDALWGVQRRAGLPAADEL